MKKQILSEEFRRMQKLAGIITEEQLNEVELKLADLGPDFEKTVKEIFGETVVVKDIDISYRPSTDTGSKPYLYMSAVIPQTKESPKGVMLNIGFFNKEGKGIVKYDNYSQDKAATAKEFEEILIPAFKKAAAVALGKIVKDPNQLNQSTVGSGYKYEEKDQADLDKYISELPNVPLINEIFGLKKKINEWALDMNAARTHITPENVESHGTYDPDTNTIEIEGGSDQMYEFFSDVYIAHEGEPENWWQNEKVIGPLRYRYEQAIEKAANQ